MNLEMLASPPPHGKISYEEFLQLDIEGSVEWVDGLVVTVGPATYQHQRLKGFLASILRIFAEERHLGKVVVGPFQMWLAQRPAGREPDVIFISQEKLASLNLHYLNGPASLVIEIASLESRVCDRGEKFYEYEQAGVPEYWFLDTTRKRAEFYRPGADGIYEQITPGPDGVYRSKVMNNLWLRVEWLWREPAPNIMEVLQEWGLV